MPAASIRKRLSTPQVLRCLSTWVLSRTLLMCAQHPGFDFSGAEFNGAAPDAQSFMGGMPSGI